MWRSSAFNPGLPVPTYHLDDGASSHTHSPGKKPVLLRNLRNQVFAPSVTVNAAYQPQPGSGIFGNPALQFPYLGRSSAGSMATPSCSDPSNESAYPEWLNCAPTGPPGDYWDGRTCWPATRRNPQPSDEIMADYDPSQPPEPMHVSGGSLEDDPMCLKVPTNTPTGPAADGAHDTQYSTVQRGPCLPPDFATSLTQSLLNQPFPLPSQQHTLFFPTGDARGGKENTQAMFGHVGAVANTHTDNPEITRRVPQTTLFGIGGLDTNLPSSGPSDQSGRDDTISPTLESLFPCSSRNGSGASDFGAMLTSLGCHNAAGSSLATPRSSAGQVESGPGSVHNVGIATLGSSSAGGGSGGSSSVVSGTAVAKRTRNFTPASVRAIDEEDEPRRASPLVRVAGYGGVDIPGDVGQ